MLQGQDRLHSLAISSFGFAIFTHDGGAISMFLVCSLKSIWAGRLEMAKGRHRGT